MKIPKGKLSEELEFYPIYTLSSNDLQALSWAFALGGIGLKEALVDCSWSLEKNQSEPIEPGLSFVKVGPLQLFIAAHKTCWYERWGQR